MYDIVYEYSPTWWPGALVASGAILGVAIATRVPPGWFRWLAWSWTVFFLFLTATLLSMYLRDARVVKAAIANGSVIEVEGRVSGFVPAPYEGHRDESFVVNGIPFSYSEYVNRGGFHRTAARGGPIRDGLEVRIHYFPEYAYNRILRLEVKRAN